MKRLLVFAAALVLIGGLAASHVQAGGWATVRLDDDPPTPVAGQEWTVTFMVKQHDITPVDLDNVYLSAQEATTGETVSKEATKLPEVGRYSVTVTFPQAGEWIWSITPDWFAPTSFPNLLVVENAEDAAAETYLPRQVAVVRDHCDTPGSAIQELPDATVLPEDAETDATTWLGSTFAQPVLTTKGTLQMSLQHTVEGTYSVVVSLAGTRVACGEIGGQISGDRLAVGVKPAGDPTIFGVAVFSANNDLTDVEIFLIKGDAPAGGGTSTARMTPTQIVKIVNEGDQWGYSPATIEIKAGTTITWINETEAPHTVSSDNPAFANSGWFDPGMSFSQTFSTPGIYDYYCWPHRTMTGEIVVTE
jgi:plastocyanin